MPLCKIHLTRLGKGILHGYQCQSFQLKVIRKLSFGFHFVTVFISLLKTEYYGYSLIYSPF